MFGLIAKHLNCVGIAVSEQGNELVERVDCGVCFLVNELLEVLICKDVSRRVQSTASDIKVACWCFCTVGVRSADGYEDDIVTQVRIFPQKTVVGGVESVADFSSGHCVILLSNMYYIK